MFSDSSFHSFASLLQGGEFADEVVSSMENTSDLDDLLVNKAVTKGYLHCNWFLIATPKNHFQTS